MLVMRTHFDNLTEVVNAKTYAQQSSIVKFWNVEGALDEIQHFVVRIGARKEADSDANAVSESEELKNLNTSTRFYSWKTVYAIYSYVQRWDTRMAETEGRLRECYNSQWSSTWDHKNHVLSRPQSVTHWKA